MLLILLLYAIVCVYGVKFHKTPNTNYLSKENTASIKGIFILMVFMSHFNSYCDFTGRFDRLYLLPFNIISQGMVTMFLFYSGYGVMESIKNKDNYVKSIPKTRILTVLFQMCMAVLMYAVLKLILEEKFTFMKLMLSFVGYESLGNSNWYIFAILVLYGITYIAFKIFKKYNLALVLLTFLVGVYALLMILFTDKAQHYYDTVLCYPLGVLWSLHREKIEKISNKNIFIYLFFTLFCIAGFLLLDNVYVSYLMLTVGILLVTMRVEFGNNFLKWCGNYLFELYILQRIPMIIFDRTGVTEYNIYLSFTLSLCITILLAIGFRNLVGRLTNKIFKKA